MIRSSILKKENPEFTKKIRKIMDENNCTRKDAIIIYGNRKMPEIVFCNNCGRSQANHTFSAWYNCQKYILKFTSSNKILNEDRGNEK